MIIEENDFRLIPVSETSSLFDLELLYIVRPKGKEERKEFKNVAYGITLDTAIKKIVQFRLHSKYDTIDLATYFSEFKKELDSLKNLCKII